MKNSRDDTLDFFRGLIIIDMIIIHYTDELAHYIHPLIAKLVIYTDIAIEGFIFISGYTIGMIYLKNTRKLDNKKILKKTIHRIITIVKAQYLLIFTAFLPAFLITNNSNNNIKEIGYYLIKSLSFQNQEGLMHILPTFIPLFILSVPIIWLINHNFRWFVALISIALFLYGNYYPYVFSIGDKTIFPIILWQIYFVLGIFAGKDNLFRKDIEKENRNKILGALIIIFLISSMFKYGHVVFPYMMKIHETTFLNGTKFPLDVVGLLYYGSIMILSYCFIIISWDEIKKIDALNKIFCLFGRNSLLCFVIHVYFCLVLKILSTFNIGNLYISISVIVGNILFFMITVFVYENKRLYKYA